MALLTDKKRSKSIVLVGSFLLTMLALGCGNREADVVENTSTAHASTFLDYRDTVISFQRLVDFAATEIGQGDVGRPIGIAQTRVWLIPMGGWTMQQEVKTVQGQYTDSLSMIVGWPYRSVRTVFYGPFHGVVSYNEATAGFDWVRQEQMLDSIGYVRSSSYHFIIIRNSSEELGLKEIVSGDEFSYRSEGAIASWDIPPKEDHLLIGELVGEDLKTKRIDLQDLRLKR